MPPLKGKDAENFMDEVSKQQDKQRDEALARCKAEAATRGKEPFDLEKLEQLCDTSSEGRLAPVERRRADLEYKYYVSNRSMMTLKEFADLIETVRKW